MNRTSFTLIYKDVNIYSPQFPDNLQIIRTVYSCVAGGGDDCYRDYNLAIDNNGYVIVANRNITNNQISRTITKLFGK